jgi:hypothetical protein
MAVDARPQLFQDLSDAVLVFDEDKVVAVAREAIAAGLPRRSEPTGTPATRPMRRSSRGSW